MFFFLFSEFQFMMQMELSNNESTCLLSPSLLDESPNSVHCNHLLELPFLLFILFT